MHPRTRELLDVLDEHRVAVRDALDATPEPLRELQPAPEKWSVAQILEHLGTVEEMLTARLRHGLVAAQAHAPLPPDPDRGSILATLDVARVLDRERTVVARDAVQPRLGLTAAAAWTRLQETRAGLHALLRDADGLRTESITADHPLFGALTFHQWIAFLGLHEARHAAQMRATVEALRGEA